MPIPEIASWKVESLRLTVFLADPVEPNGLDSTAQSWWKSITGQESETTTSKRQTGEHIVEGGFGDWRFNLSINSLSNRVDWVAYPTAPELHGISTIGSYVASPAIFYKALNNWLLTLSPPALRIAYGVVLLNEVPERKTGYEMLASYLPIIKINADTWSDFFFQVNNKVKSAVLVASPLNVVSKWAAIKTVRIQVNTSEAPSAASVELNACRLELDLSTAVENKTSMEPANLSTLFNEFRAIADQYVSKGYPA